MGYRSDVAYVVKFKSFQDRDAYVSLQLAKNDEVMKEAIFECEYEYKSEPLLTFEAGDVKWYDGYVNVIAHTSIYKDAHELFKASYRFGAIGEDGAEQVEEEGDEYMYDYLYPVHKLETNFPSS
jgi:hypothetical protein